MTGAGVVRRQSRADHVARATRGYELRVSGWSWRAISDELGYSSAHNAMKSIRKFAGGLPDIDVDELRRGSLARTLIYATKAMEAVEANRPGALRDAMAVEARLCSLLGLDAPQRAEVTSHSTQSIFAMVYPVAEMPAVGAPIELERQV